MDISRFGIDFKVSDSELNRHFFETYFPNWEESTYQFLMKYWNKDKVFIDIGAWVGPISIIAAYHSKEVLAFEPDHVAFAELLENIKLNNMSNIRPSIYAVSTMDKIQLGCPVLGQSGTRTGCEENSFEAKCTTLKNIFDRNQLSECDVSAIKIDIEGHEEVLLKDNFIMQLRVPMHIALHPGYRENRLEYINNIRPFFDMRGIDIEEGCYHRHFFDIEVP